MKDFLIKADGTYKEIEPKNGTDYSLKELQEYVGGYIERLSTVLYNTILIVDEEARLKSGSKVNGLASVFFGYELLGDVVVITDKSRFK